MKKLLYLLLTVLIVACSDEDGSNDGDNNNSNNVDYFFEVEIGGEIFRVQGNTEDQASIPFAYSDWLLYNKCVGSTDGVEFSITDITRDNFISGQNMNFGIMFENAQLGDNIGYTGFLNPGFYIEQYLNSIGAIYNPLLFVENTTMSYLDGEINNVVGKISNINLTDLGTPPTVNSATGNIIYGETIKGTYDGILYFLSSPPAPGANYDIAVPIRVAFNAVRL
mgnify:FL=1|jgi:hypothetical protein